VAESFSTLKNELIHQTYHTPERPDERFSPLKGSIIASVASKLGYLEPAGVRTTDR
jgi:hypothetical protein